MTTVLVGGPAEDGLEFTPDGFRPPPRLKRLAHRRPQGPPTECARLQARAPLAREPIPLPVRKRRALAPDIGTELERRIGTLNDLLQVIRPRFHERKLPFMFLGLKDEKREDVCKVVGHDYSTKVDLGSIEVEAARQLNRPHALLGRRGRRARLRLGLSRAGRVGHRARALLVPFVTSISDPLYLSCDLSCGQTSMAGEAFASEVVFDQIAELLKGDPEVGKKAPAIFQFVITKGPGGKTAHWVVDAKTGEVRQEKATKPDCTMTLADADFVAMASGKLAAQVLRAMVTRRAY